MNWVRVGRAFRAVRLRLNHRQQDVAGRAGVSRSVISLIERGHLERLSFEMVSRVAGVLEIRLDVTPRWRGGDLDRLLNASHSALHEVVGEMFDELPEWVRGVEVSFAVYAERGVIDVLAFHPPTGSLLVIELKTEIVDVQDLVGRVDVKARLATRIARDRGWNATSVSVWVAVAESRTNRRRAAAHRSMLRAAFPDDGRRLRAWLTKPDGVVRALGFVTDANGASVSRRITSPKRVHRQVQAGERG
jgi:transcriptional regulator with XRE-family HTH domain